MTHPDDLLPAYVDGTASTDERAVVDAHLSSCARCRTEVDLAARGRSAARALPRPDAPDLSAAVAAAIGKPDAAPRSASMRRFRLVGLAAAAVVAIAIAISLPRVGTAPPSEDRAEVGAATPTVGTSTQLAALVLEVQDTDYDDDAVQDLAREAAGGAEGASSSGEVVRASPTQTARAQACLAQAFPDFPGTPTRLIAARYQGAPAYLAVVLEGPAPGQPADTASIWVAARDGCAPLTFTTLRI